MKFRRVQPYLRVSVMRLLCGSPRWGYVRWSSYNASVYTPLCEIAVRWGKPQ